MALLRVIPQHTVEGGPIGEISRIRNAHRMAQQRLRRHQDQRFAEIAVHLTAQDVEVVGRCGAVGHDPVVMG